MTAPLDWRKIERVLVEWFEGEEWSIAMSGATGDKTAEKFEYDDGTTTSSVNLTALAKHLADELGGTT